MGVLQQIDISGGGNPDSFLPQAVNFANNKCWGNLSCTLIVDPVTQKANQSAVDTAIADLRYGSVNINLPTVLGYAVMKMAWGGFPGATPQVVPFIHSQCLSLHLLRTMHKHSNVALLLLYAHMPCISNSVSCPAAQVHCLTVAYWLDWIGAVLQPPMNLLVTVCSRYHTKSHTVLFCGTVHQGMLCQSHTCKWCSGCDGTQPEL